MREELLRILEDINPDADYEKCNTLVDDRYIDSLGMLSLVAEIEDTFDIAIPAVEVTPENFNSLDGMCSLVERIAADD